MQGNCEVQEVEYAAYIGVDWGDKEHSICLQAADSKRVEEFTVKQKPEVLHDWILQLFARFGGRKVALAIEQTKGAVIHALLAYDFVHVFRIPPKSLANYRKAFACSGAKDDPTDAALLLDWVRLHRDKIKAWVPDDPKTRALQRFVEFRRKLVGERVRLTNMLTQALKDYFPQALKWAGGLDTVMACDFLSKWPTLENIQKAKPEQVRKFYQDHRCRRSDVLEKRLREIAAARPLTEDFAVVTTSITVVRAIVPLVRSLIASIDRVDREIHELFQEHKDHDLFDSFPGAGAALAPRLLSAMGSDRNRFDTAQEVQEFSGIAPVTERSGKSKWIHHRVACPKFLKQSFHEFSGQSIKFSTWARAYYDMQRAQGKEHHAAVRSLAYKWIRVIFRCWKDSTRYNEETYQQRLRMKQSPLLEYLDPAA